MSDEMERAREWLMKPENWQRIMLRLRAMHDGKSPSAQELYAFLAPVLAAYAREREQWRTGCDCHICEAARASNAPEAPQP
jgi:hypothetical protein